MELWQKTVPEAARLLKRREISARELAESSLRRREETQDLNAYLTRTDREEVYRMADLAQKLLDSGGAGPLAGIPMGLKDNIVTCGIRTTCASRMLENFVPSYDAHVWETLKAAGAVLMGKHNMDEFGMGNTGPSGRSGTRPILPVCPAGAALEARRRWHPEAAFMRWEATRAVPSASPRHSAAWSG